MRRLGGRMRTMHSRMIRPCPLPLPQDFVPIAVASLDASHQPHPALPRLLLPLRPDQLRSLQWMRQREADPRRLDGEELVTHGISTTPLQEWAVQWRLRGAFRLSGGVLADAIGHGKTAVALALVEAARQTALPVVPAGLGPGLLPSKATVIVVPPHLVSQWEGEIRKFLGHQLRLVTLMTYSDLVCGRVRARGRDGARVRGRVNVLVCSCMGHTGTRERCQV